MARVIAGAGVMSSVKKNLRVVVPEGMYEVNRWRDEKLVFTDGTSSFDLEIEDVLAYLKSGQLRVLDGDLLGSGVSN